MRDGFAPEYWAILRLFVFSVLAPLREKSLTMPPTMKKNPIFSRLLVISGVLLLSLPVYPQTRNPIEPLPKLLSVREQQAVRESWLKKRLDTVLLPMMRQQKIDMWIVVNEEFHADPVTEYVAPP